MTFFDEISEAERYARSRPYFHPQAIARAKEAMGIEGMFPVALDAACGTGLSTNALTTIANLVIGLDISMTMLAFAPRGERTFFLQARSEAMPFSGGSMPLLSTALAFHWFDREKFLREAWRVLVDDGLLLVYTNGFTGTMHEDDSFQNWARKDYQERFPTPPRDTTPLSAAEASRFGFKFIGEESYENDVYFTPEELVDYLTTQTNVAAAVAQGRESYVSASTWLLEQVRPYFTGKHATFVFSSRAWYLRKELLS